MTTFFDVKFGQMRRHRVWVYPSWVDGTPKPEAPLVYIDVCNIRDLRVPARTAKKSATVLYKKVAYPTLAPGTRTWSSS